LYRIVISPQSNKDLDDIFHFIARSGFPENAAGFTEDIMTFCESLHTFPHRGTAHPGVKKGLRTIGFHKQVCIVFRVDEENQIVTIVRILHGKQNLKKALKYAR
jgi:plasmid stabilization system protein ParE